MRDNSGKGDSENNLRDPTLKEHEAEGGRRPPAETPGDAATIGADASRDEDLSPDDRQRGETSSADEAPPVDAGP